MFVDIKCHITNKTCDEVFEFVQLVRDLRFSLCKGILVRVFLNMLETDERPQI